MAAPVFAPPHPPGVFRLLRQAWREYAASGNACATTVNTPAGQAASAPLPVSGILYVDASMRMPPQVLVNIMRFSDNHSAEQQLVNVNPTTGNYSVTFAGGIPADTYRVNVSLASIGLFQFSATFVLT